MTATVSSYGSNLGAWLAAHQHELGAYRQRAGGGVAGAVEHDRGLMRLLHGGGWSRWGWPVESGGLGGPIALRAVLYDQLAAAHVEIPEVFVILETLGPVLVEYAPHLAARHLPAYLAGDELWGQGFSEPEAGSDLAALRTKATPAPNGFRLTGQKTWTTLGQFARYAAVLARTGAQESAHRGLSLLWVDLQSEGVEVRPVRAANGREEFAELFFDDVAVPRDHLIGELDGGWGVAMFLLQYERGMYAWQRQATLHRRLGQVAATADPADTAGLGALGAAYLDAAALRARSSVTVSRLSAGENPGPEISVDKILLSRAEQATFDAARRLAWPRMALSPDAEAGTLREEWFYSRASSIFGGAVDIQRDIVAEHVLGLPRERRSGR